MNWILNSLLFTLFLGLLAGCSAPVGEPLAAKIIGPSIVGFYNLAEFHAEVSGYLSPGATIQWSADDVEVTLRDAGLRTVSWEPDSWRTRNYQLTLTVTHPDHEPIRIEHAFKVQFCSSGDWETPADPCGLQNITQIQDIDDLLDGHFILLNDIVGSALVGNRGVFDDDGNRLFWPIAGDVTTDGGRPDKAFAGSFNGDGYKITNLSIIWPDLNGVGLFSALAEGAVVENVHLDNAHIVGKASVGGIVGFSDGKILRSSVTDSNISFGDDVVNCDVDNPSRGRFIGGLLGRSTSTSAIMESYTLRTDVLGCNYVGGFGGFLAGSTADSYSMGGSVSASSLIWGPFQFTNRGGFAGAVGAAGARVIRSFALMGNKVAHTFSVPGDSWVLGSFWSPDYDGVDTVSHYATSITAEEFGNPDTFIGAVVPWDFDEVWQMGVGIPRFSGTLPDLRNNPR